MTRWRRLLSPFLLVLGLCCPGAAWALHLSVAPSVVDAEIPPDTTARVVVTVMNGEATPIRIRHYFEDWWHDGEASVYASPGTTAHSAVGWASVLPEDLVVEGDSVATLELFLTPPEGAAGTYTALLFVEALPGTPGEGASLSVGGRIGVPVAVRILGTGTESIVLQDVQVSPPTASAPLRVEVGVRNDGDVHVSPALQGVLVDADGEVRGRLDGEPRRILPGQRRTLEALWGGQLAPGTYQLVLTVGYGTGKAVTTTSPVTVGAPEP